MVKLDCSPRLKRTGDESITRDIIAILAKHSRVTFPVVEGRDGGADGEAAKAGNYAGAGPNRRAHCLQFRMARQAPGGACGLGTSLCGEDDLQHANDASVAGSIGVG